MIAALTRRAVAARRRGRSACWRCCRRSSRPPSPELAPAADTSAFRPGNIITDAVFYDSGAMSAAQVQAFLNQQGGNCTPASGGPACLKDYRHDDADAGRGRLLPGPLHRRRERDRRGDHRQGRRGLRDQPAGPPGDAPEGDQPRHAVGADRAPLRPGDGLRLPGQLGGTCSAYYPGLFKQIYFAAKQFKRYAANPSNYGHVPGIVNNVRFNPNTACGSSPVLIAEQGDREPVQLHALPAQRGRPWPPATRHPATRARPTATGTSGCTSPTGSAAPRPSVATSTRPSAPWTRSAPA